MVELLKAEKRKRTGTGAAKKYRAEGKLPAVVYGKKIHSSILIDRYAFARFVERGERIFELNMDGKKVACQLKDLQYTTPAEQIIHADFLALTAGEKVDIEVSVVLRGDPVGVKEGGVMNLIAHTLQVRCDPTNVPESIRVDVSELGMNETLHIRDLNLPDGVELVGDLDDPVVTVSPSHEEPEAEEAVLDAESAEPEVISREKEDGEAQEEE